jgi:acyl-coenzyme A thioesterase PaaI-like protein
MTHPDMSNIEIPDGCIPVDTPFGTDAGKSFVEGDPNGKRLRVQMFMRETDRRLISKIWFGPDAEGPPGHAHGGSMAAVLDHTMGVACWVEGYPVVAASITINFIKGLPLSAMYTVENWVERVDGKKVFAAGKIFLDDTEDPYATGSGLFIHKSLEDFRSLADGSKHKPISYEPMNKFFKEYPKRTL